MDDTLDDLLGDITIPKVQKELKGDMIAFYNKKRQLIVGKGTLYYVVRFEGKLYYKEASQVTKIDNLTI